MLQPELIVRKPLEMFRELPLHVSVTFASGARDCRCYRIEREGDNVELLIRTVEYGHPSPVSGILIGMHSPL